MFLLLVVTCNECGLLKFGVLTKPMYLYTSTVYSVSTSKHIIKVHHTTVACFSYTTSWLYYSLHAIFCVAITLSSVLGRDGQLACHLWSSSFSCSTVVLTCTVFRWFFLEIAKQQRWESCESHKIFRQLHLLFFYFRWIVCSGIVTSITDTAEGWV